MVDLEFNKIKAVALKTKTFIPLAKFDSECSIIFDKIRNYLGRCLNVKKYQVKIEDGILIFPEELVKELDIKEGQEVSFEKKGEAIIISFKKQ